MSGTANVMSLAELDGYRSDTLAWDLALPEYVPAEQIGVNVALLGRVARLGGLEHVRVGAYSGDRTETQAEVSSMGPDGSATASMKAVQSKAETVRSGLTKSGERVDSLYSEYWWADAMIDVNATELSDKILNHGRKGGSVRDPKPWAHYLNKDLKRGLSRSTKQQLLGNVSGMSRMDAGFTVAVGFIYSIGDLNPENVIMKGLTYSIILQSMKSAMNSARGNPLSERILSLMSGYQVDRLAIAQALLKAHKLVKPLNNQS